MCWNYYNTRYNGLEKVAIGMHCDYEIMVPKSVNLMTLNGEMAIILRHFIEFGSF